MNLSQAGFFTELRVNALRQLNQVTVECQGISGSFMSTINIASVLGTIVNLSQINIIND